MSEYIHITHPFEPVFDSASEILILGSLPSVKSREQGFYYAHPRNRFWKVISAIYQEKEPLKIEEKKKILLKNRIAVWDVIESCDIKGSSDSSIKNVIAADIGGLLKKTKISSIYANGKTAGSLYEKFILADTEKEIVILPSTSPANAAYSLERLIENWSILRNK